MLQSGLDEKRWSDSMECYCSLRNVQDLVADWKNSLWKTIRRTAKKSHNSIWSIGWISSNLNAWSNKSSSFRKEVLPGIFRGYALIAGGLWKGDIPIADLEEFQNVEASEIYPHRINAKEILTRQKGAEFIFYWETSLKPLQTSGRFKVTSSIVITMIPDFNSTCRKMKNFLFHWR